MMTSANQWAIRRKNEHTLELTLPKDFKLTGDDITIEDLLSAIATHQSILDGRLKARCCSGDVAIA